MTSSLAHPSPPAVNLQEANIQLKHELAHFKASSSAEIKALEKERACAALELQAAQEELLAVLAARTEGGGKGGVSPDAPHASAPAPHSADSHPSQTPKRALPSWLPFVKKNSPEKSSAGKDADIDDDTCSQISDFPDCAELGSSNAGNKRAISNQAKFNQMKQQRNTLRDQLKLAKMELNTLRENLKGQQRSKK
eukprot:CAMPEP_0196589580 /NCGR_PEP_ID=MMETSP1081-20130531/63970_1 /TAXON_ID=36882 /ORGANISM="Pyramimonas amylifera, Strain CCMP720" /LENGTH=194 /DNA_ID=CAMNT_0041912425 /DNA_START=338 /DNA_END=922 /DNA_ORIENTATION=-